MSSCVLQPILISVDLSPPKMALVPYSIVDGRILLHGEPLAIVTFEAEPDILWFKANPIHNFTGARTVSHTLTRVYAEDKSSLTDLVASKGLPRVGARDAPTPNHLDYHEGKAIYVNELGLYAIILGSVKPEMKAPLGEWTSSTCDLEYPLGLNGDDLD